MRTFLRIMFFFFLTTRICVGQWIWQNPLPQGNTLNDVCFVDENKGWAIGERGTVLQTIDGGVTWAIRDLGTGIDFKAMSFVDQYNGWFLGTSDSGGSSVNRIYKTTNGGADWFIKSEIDTIREFGTISLLSSIFFVNANIGWAIGDVILKTTNGGDDWFYQSNSIAEFREYTDCYFINENTGWILCVELISAGNFDRKLSFLITTDGGTTWIEKQIRDTIQYDYEDFITGEIFFINNNLGWTTAMGDIFKTTDGGLNWTQKTITDGNLSSIFFLSDQVGYAVGGGQIFKTTDGGINWNEQYFDQMSFSSVFFKNMDMGFIVGNSGEILKTTDYGESWIPFNDNFCFYLSSICMVDALNGWVAGTRMLKTTDGGLNWDIIEQPYSILPIVFFIDTQIGWVGGYGSGIWKTTDSGNSWVMQADGNIEDIFFINENYGWAIRDDIFIRTTNGGEIWSDVNTVTTEPLRKILFLNENIGWAIGLWSIIKTTDSGINWSVQNSPIEIGSESQLSKIYFSDTSNGWISINLGGTWSGELFATSDGGQTWQTQLTGVFNMELEFIDNNTGYLIGGEQEGLFSSFKSVVYKTTNGGTNWVSQPIGTHKWLWDISVSDANNGWIVGEGGTILHTSNSGVVPVELTAFTAQAENQKVILKWTTATELNNNGFEIQRRVAESDFATIGFVKGEGTTTTQKEYSYTDRDLADGKYFYRLKQVDYNGSYEYSNVIEVDVRSLNEYALEPNYPNPFNPTTTIGYVLKDKSNAKLILLNAIGEEVSVLVNEEQEKGFHTVDFNASTLASGVYFYQLKAGEFVETKKMLLIK